MASEDKFQWNKNV